MEENCIFQIVVIIGEDGILLNLANAVRLEDRCYGKATLTGTDTLAGSSIHLMDGLRRAVSYGVPLEAAVTAATLAPAKAIRMDDQIGSLAVGKYADFVLLDQELNVKAVYINGKNVL